MTAITEVPLLGRLIEVDQKTFQTVFSSNRDAFVVGISSWGMLDYTYSKDPTGKVLLAFPTLEIPEPLPFLEPIEGTINPKP